MPRDLQLLNIPDLIWVDYLAIVLWTRAKQNKDASFILGKDFPIVKNIRITFGIIVELYARGIIEKIEINQNMKRIVTLASKKRKVLEEEIKSGQKNFSILYGLLDSSSSHYDITIYSKKEPLAKFLNKRLKQWLSEKSYTNTVNPKSIVNQKTTIGNELVRIIKEEELMGKNIKFSCGKFIHDSDMGARQDVIVSEVNPFLVLYSFEKEKLIELVDTDFDTIRLSVRADLQLETKKKLLSEEIVYKYEFEVPTNKRKEGIYFNTETGEVICKGKVLGILKANTRPYKLFLLLYTDQGKYKTFTEICDGIESGQGEKEKVVADIKREMPKEISMLIHTGKGSYRLAHDKELNP